VKDENHWTAALPDPRQPTSGPNQAAETPYRRKGDRYSVSFTTWIQGPALKSFRIRITGFLSASGRSSRRIPEHAVRD
jgi:hypothetical protein